MNSILLLSELEGGGSMTWLLGVALAFFVAMVFIGWLASRRTKE